MKKGKQKINTCLATEPQDAIASPSVPSGGCETRFSQPGLLQFLPLEATRAIRQAEVGAARTMIDRVALKPKQLAGDSAYGATPMLASLVKNKAIAPLVSTNPGVWMELCQEADSTFGAEHNVHVRPQGELLRTAGRVHGDWTLLYRSQEAACDLCARKLNCCPHTPHRKIATTLMKRLATGPEPSMTRPPSSGPVGIARGNENVSF